MSPTTVSVLADVLQIAQGVAVVLLLLMALGAWRNKQEVSALQLSKDLEVCQAQCDRRVSGLEHWRDEVVPKELARTDVVAVELRGINTRLKAIEILLAHVVVPHTED